MGVLYFETINKIRFLESRAYELDKTMEEVRSDIDIAIEKYGRIIEYENTSNSAKLNDIMALFTIFSIACLPAASDVCAGAGRRSQSRCRLGRPHRPGESVAKPNCDGLRSRAAGRSGGFSLLRLLRVPSSTLFSSLECHDIGWLSATRCTRRVPF